jgi:hypothetical protein
MKKLALGLVALSIVGFASVPAFAADSGNSGSSNTATNRSTIEEGDNNTVHQEIYQEIDRERRDGTHGDDVDLNDALNDSDIFRGNGNDVHQRVDQYIRNRRGQ